ncbi:YheC/YheD family protein [Xylanibacillus composti]|nr:YheC/YheD family protein [Xylanibacillus composti]
MNLQISHNAFPSDHTIVLRDSLIKKWKIPGSVILRYGSTKQAVSIASASRQDGIRMTERLASRLGLKPGTSLRALYRPKTKTLHLGPVIGVLLGSTSQNASRPFGSTTSFCMEMVEAGKLYGGFVYFFTPKQIDWREKRIRGWSYSNGWYQASFPMPEVVYNRLMSRKLEANPSVQHFIREVKSRYGTATFNERYLDKIEVFTALRRDAGARSYLPYSCKYKGYATLKHMLGKYRTVFLKPERGSLGKGIIKITQNPAGGFTCHFSHLNGVTQKSASSTKQVHNLIAGRAKSSRFQAQQGLNLIRIGGRPVDFRALTHKDENGKWSLTSIVGRIAGSNHFVSNLARGGTLSPAKEALSRAGLKASGAVLQRLKKAALNVAQGVENQIPAQFGEFGVDLAVDTAGRVWLLEVNSKPAKNDSTPLSDQKIRPSVKRLIQYSRHLAGL